MSASPQPLRRTPGVLSPPDHVRTDRLLQDGGACGTTIYAAAHAPDEVRVRVRVLRRPEPLASWCARRGFGEALVGGFFVRGAGRDTWPLGTPVGELRTAGVVRRHVPFLEPWAAVRGCVHTTPDGVRIAARDALPAVPRGDVLQAGPLLVTGGRPVVEDGRDPEGFSAGSEQFDSDITAGRHPRAALGVCSDGTILAVACDGRAPDEAGLTLGELALGLADLGAVAAVNLDGGGSTALVAAGALQNLPREGDGTPIPGGRAVSTALVFEPR